jgi:hypothetical protein
LAVGLPTVVPSDLEAVAEWAGPPGPGLLSLPRDAMAFADGIDAALDDRVMLGRHSQAARRRVEHLDHRSALAALVEALGDLVGLDLGELSANSKAP